MRWTACPTWALPLVLGEDWLQDAWAGWRHWPDGRWRPMEGAGQDHARERRTRRPVVVAYEWAEWDAERFAAERERCGRAGTDERECAVVEERDGERPQDYRRRLYEARRAATHAVVAVVRPGGAQGTAGEYLRLCAREGAAPGWKSGAEERMAEALVALGAKAERQARVGRYRADFLLRGPRGRSAVEVDGRHWHTDAEGRRLAADKWRDEVLGAVGVRTIRVWADEVDADPEGAARRAVERHEA